MEAILSQENIGKFYILTNAKEKQIKIWILHDFFFKKVLVKIVGIYNRSVLKWKLKFENIKSH